MRYVYVLAIIGAVIFVAGRAAIANYYLRQARDHAVTGNFALSAQELTTANSVAPNAQFAGQWVRRFPSDLKQKIGDELMRQSFETARRRDSAQTIKITLSADQVLADDATGQAFAHIRALRSLADGNLDQAGVHIRQSIETEPPLDASDERYAFLFYIAAQIAQKNNCEFSASNRVYSLLAFYAGDALEATPDCRERVATSSISHAQKPELPYLLLQQARLSLFRGDMARARQQFTEAEINGLSSAWRLSLMNEVSTGATITSQNVISGDVSVRAYEYDPLQLELGLPTQFIFYFRNSDAPVMYQLVNLAPNAGFEYSDPENVECDKCMVSGYVGDQYHDASIKDLYEALQTQRPFLANGAATYASQALKIDNPILQKGQSPNSALRTLPRTINYADRFLYAGWLKTNGGTVSFGRQWYNSLQQPPWDTPILKPATSEWTYQSMVVKPYHLARRVDLWLMAIGTESAVWYDQILFIRLPTNAVRSNDA